MEPGYLESNYGGVGIAVARNVPSQQPPSVPNMANGSV